MSLRCNLLNHSCVMVTGKGISVPAELFRDKQSHGASDEANEVFGKGNLTP